MPIIIEIEYPYIYIDNQDHPGIIVIKFEDEGYVVDGIAVGGDVIPFGWHEYHEFEFDESEEE